MAGPKGDKRKRGGVQQSRHVVRRLSSPFATTAKVAAGLFHELGNCLESASAWLGSKIRGEEKVEKKDSPLQFPLDLPEDLYLELAKHVNENEALAFSLTCKGFRDAMKEVSKKKENKGPKKKWLRSSRSHYCVFYGVQVSEDWIKWAHSMTFEWEDDADYTPDDDDNEWMKIAFLHRRAARGGYLDTLKYLKSEGATLEACDCHAAAYGGHIDVLKYLKSEGVAFDQETCNRAAERGHLAVLKYLKSEGVECNSSACNEAAEGGHIDVLKYLKSEGVAFGQETCSDAARGGHIKVLKYLKSEGVSLDEDLYYDAAHGGHINILEYLKSEGVPLKPWICAGAAIGGHIGVLKYLRSEGVQFNSRTCTAAAEEGHPDVLKYLASEGVPFDEETSCKAAKNGHVDVLKYLKSEGAPFDDDICWDAVEGGQVKVLEYLKSAGIISQSDTTNEGICNQAADLGHFEVLKWLRKAGWPWEAGNCLRYAKRSAKPNEEMIEWIESFLDEDDIFSDDDDFSDTDEGVYHPIGQPFGHGGILVGVTFFGENSRQLSLLTRQLNSTAMTEETALAASTGGISELH